MTGGKQFQEALFKFWMLLVKNGVGHQIDQGGDIKQARERNHLALEFEGVGHCQRVGMVGARQKILRLKVRALLQDGTAYFGQGVAIAIA